MKTIFATVALVTFATNIAIADILVLRDGTEITGTIWDPDEVREDPQSRDVVRIQTRGHLVPIESSRIYYLVFGDSQSTGEKIYFHPAPPTDPQSELASATGDSLSAFECYTLGKRDGCTVSTSGSLAGGLAAGLFLGFAGALIAVVVQSEPEPSRASLLALGGDECRHAYSEAFMAEGKSKKKNAALMGGLVGAGILLTVVIVAVASADQPFGNWSMGMQ